MGRVSRRLTLALLLSLLLALAGVASRPQAQTVASRWLAEKVWSDETADATGHVSADGRFLTFINWATFELGIRDLATGTNRTLAPPSQFYGSYFSQDGRHVAYSAYDSKRDAAPQLYVIPATGGTPRVIGAGRVDTAWVHGWAPDGQELLVIVTKALHTSAAIGFMNIETAGFRAVGAVEPGATARLSPDSSQIVVAELASPDRTQRDIRLIDFRTGRSQPLLTGPADDYAPDWDPDGQSIYFLSDRGNRARLWRLRVSASPWRPEALAEIPDGDDRIVGVTRDRRIYVGGYDIGGTNSYVADVDWRSGEVSRTRLLANPPLRGSRRAVLSNDEEQVAFLRRRRGYGVRPGWQIPVVQSFDGRRERVYDTVLTIRDEPAWFPDGSALVYAVPPEGAVGESTNRLWRFMRLDLAKGTFSEIGDAGAPGHVRLAGLIADELCYLLSDVGWRASAVLALNLKTGARRELYRHDTTISDAAVAPDGQRIAFAARQPDRTVAVFVVSPAGSGPERIAVIQPNGGAQLAWFSDGQALVTSGRLNGRLGVWRLPVNGPPVRLGLDLEDVTEVRAGVGGRRIAFTRRFQRNREIWSYRLPAAGREGER